MNTPLRKQDPPQTPIQKPSPRVLSIHCATHGEFAGFYPAVIRNTRNLTPISSGLDSCKGCVELRRAYTCTPAYQKRAERRRHWKKVAKAIASCGVSLAQFNDAAKATAAAMVRLRNCIPRSRITVARDARAGR